MIAPFKVEDLGAFVPNQYSDPDHVLEQLRDPDYTTETLWGDDGLVKAILCYRQYADRCWLGFFLISTNFVAQYGVELRKHIHRTMERLNAIRLHTDSPANDLLQKWHQFLGFGYEGTRHKFMFSRDYDMWAIVREGV